MHVPSRLIWVALACCLALPITPVATTPVFAADVAEVREYLARAQARLAERDPVSVDNLLHLAEVALEDLPPQISRHCRSKSPRSGSSGRTTRGPGGQPWSKSGSRPCSRKPS